MTPAYGPKRFRSARPLPLPVAQQALGQVSPSSLPPPQLMNQLATGLYVSRAFFVVANLGIADLLKDGLATTVTLRNPPELILLRLIG